MRVGRGLILVPLVALAFGTGLSSSSGAAPPPEPPIGWTNQFGTPLDESGGFGEGASIGRSPSGDVYVASTTTGGFPGSTPAGLADAFVARFDKNGTRLWVRQFGSAAEDVVTGIVVSSTGDAFVIGWTRGDFDGAFGPGSFGLRDAFVARLDKNGTLKWVAQFGTSQDDVATAVAISGSNDLYLGGFTDGTLPAAGPPGLGHDAFVARWDKNANQKWIRQFGSAGDDEVTGLALRGSSEIYLTGRTNGDMGNFQGAVDGFVTRYDKNGAQLWIQQFGASDIDRPTGVAVAGTSEVYVVGSTDSDPLGAPGQHAGGLDGFVARYDKAGGSVWVHQFGTTEYDDARSVAVTKTGTVYVVGYTEGDLDAGGPGAQLGSGDFYLMGMSTGDGTPVFRQFGTAGFEAWPHVVLTSTGLPVVAGLTSGTVFGHASAGGLDVVVTRFPAS